MQVKKLREILKGFNGENDVFVVKFKNNRATREEFEIASSSNIGGRLQLEIYEHMLSP